jgi:hypothetical protein
MSILDAIGSICAGACLIYFVVLVIYTAIDMQYLPGKSFLVKRRHEDDEQ